MGSEMCIRDRNKRFWDRIREENDIFSRRKYFMNIDKLREQLIIDEGQVNEIYNVSVFNFFMAFWNSASNKFREDLLFRLNVFPIDVPDLSQRHEDIPEIIEHFIEKKSLKSGSTSRPIFDAKALEVLQKYDWPGNIREVRNIVDRAIVFFPKILVFRNRRFFRTR